MSYSLAISVCKETGRSCLSVIDHDGDFITEVPDPETGRQVIENLEQYEEYLADMAETDDIVFDDESLELEFGGFPDGYFEWE
jgi:hypothetical protein